MQQRSDQTALPISDAYEHPSSCFGLWREASGALLGSPVAGRTLLTGGHCVEVAHCRQRDEPVASNTHMSSGVSRSPSNTLTVAPSCSEPRTHRPSHHGHGRCHELSGVGQEIAGEIRTKRDEVVHANEAVERLGTQALELDLAGRLEAEFLLDELGRRLAQHDLHRP